METYYPHHRQSDSTRLALPAKLWHLYFGTVKVFSWLTTFLLLPQLLFETAALNCWITHHILQIFERFATWTASRERWNCHSGHKWLVWTARWKALRWWCKSVWTSLEKMYCAWRGRCWKCVKRLCSWSIVSMFFSLLIEQPLYVDHPYPCCCDLSAPDTVRLTSCTFYTGHWSGGRAAI